MALIPARNPKALIGYYCGVFGLLLVPCVGLILGPVAIILGILGNRHARTYPEAEGGGHAVTAIILGALALLLNIMVCIVVLFVYLKPT